MLHRGPAEWSHKQWHHRKPQIHSDLHIIFTLYNIEIECFFPLGTEDRPNAPHMLEGFCHCFLYAMAATPALPPIGRVLLYLLFAGNDRGVSVIASTCTDPAVTPNIRATTAPSMASHKPLRVRLRKEHTPWPLSEIFTDTFWGGQESTGVVT